MSACYYLRWLQVWNMAWNMSEHTSAFFVELQNTGLIFFKHNSRSERDAFPQIRTGSQKVHKKVHVPTGLPINAYNPKWLEGREALSVKHVLCPNMREYMFAQ
jgi:hypothetical protein